MSCMLLSKPDQTLFKKKTIINIMIRPKCNHKSLITFSNNIQFLLQTKWLMIQRLIAECGIEEHRVLLEQKRYQQNKVNREGHSQINRKLNIKCVFVKFCL